MSLQHPVEPGECLSALAHRFRFGDGRAIWAHPDNAALRKKRPDPNALLPGDVVAIPDKEVRKESVPVGKRAVFRMRRARAWLRLFLRDDDGTPLAGKKYWLVTGNSGFEGRTDERGRLEQRIPPDARAADLVVWMDEEDVEAEVLAVSLQIGHLPPLEEPAGAQARLTSLGYPCGDAEMPAALRAFQKARGLPESGALDAATLDRLRRDYEGA
jgi:N-acetylmuramoyl-L-alanine amidase